VMATANHYLADAIAGAVITLVVFFALNRLWGSGSERRKCRPGATNRPGRMASGPSYYPVPNEP
jgi:hypothetical protein